MTLFTHVAHSFTTVVLALTALYSLTLLTLSRIPALQHTRRRWLTAAAIFADNKLNIAPTLVSQKITIFARRVMLFTMVIYVTLAILGFYIGWTTVGYLWLLLTLIYVPYYLTLASRIKALTLTA